MDFSIYSGLVIFSVRYQEIGASTDSYAKSSSLCVCQDPEMNQFTPKSEGMVPVIHDSFAVLTGRGFNCDRVCSLPLSRGEAWAWHRHRGPLLPHKPHCHLLKGSVRCGLSEGLLGTRRVGQRKYTYAQALDHQARSGLNGIILRNSKNISKQKRLWRCSELAASRGLPTPPNQSWQTFSMKGLVGHTIPVSQLHNSAITDWKRPETIYLNKRAGGCVPTRLCLKASEPDLIWSPTTLAPAPQISPWISAGGGLPCTQCAPVYCSRSCLTAEQGCPEGPRSSASKLDSQSWAGSKNPAKSGNYGLRQLVVQGEKTKTLSVTAEWTIMSPGKDVLKD